jgi:hypothetical protein
LNPGGDSILKHLPNADRFLFPALRIAPAHSIWWGFFLHGVFPYILFNRLQIGFFHQRLKKGGLPSLGLFIGMRLADGIPNSQA